MLVPPLLAFIPLPSFVVGSKESPAIRATRKSQSQNPWQVTSRICRPDLGRRPPSFFNFADGTASHLAYRTSYLHGRYHA